ncbi:hypothetical protein C0Q70_20870 [Pomacea canaliculata]|uniref:Amino acid transporter n=1 Tax=Pomacea canaliculata TaxID=400727 RepID=A0A2T7NAY3_POMCA|nr:hypothetical protein C0Q70_20870 [Pomacea canaliculata]
MNPPRQISPEEESLTAEIQKNLKNEEVVIETFDTKQAFVPKVKIFLRGNALLILTMVGIVAGFALGFGIRELDPSRGALMWLGMPGELFLRLLKMMILPLIVCTVITGTASLDPKANGKISAVAFAYIVSTNVIACAVAIFLCLVIKPGVGQLSVSANTAEQEPMETQDIFADLLRNIFPDNMMEATFRKSQTMYRKNSEVVERNTTNGTSIVSSLIALSKYSGKADGINVLGLIVICTVVGIAMNQLPGQGQHALQVSANNGDSCKGQSRLVFVYALTPLGVGQSDRGLHRRGTRHQQRLRPAGQVRAGRVPGYRAAPVSHPSLHPLRHHAPQPLQVPPQHRPTLCHRLRVHQHVRESVHSVCIPLSTHRAVAIPEMLESCEKNKVDSRVARFVIPFCVTLNADGSALYITSAAIFIAQLTGVGVGVSDVIIIGVLTAVAAMAIPSVPSASIVTLVVILTSLNIPANDIALLFAVEWFLDRIRTTCNVVSHTFCAAVTHKFCQKALQTHPQDKLDIDSECDDISSYV